MAINIKRDKRTIPNPGSDEALKLGCRCPVLDNNHGMWAPWPPDGWWVTQSCKMHWNSTLER